VKWVRAESLVRGLDYYRHTAFEFIPNEGSASAAALGSQSTVLGGGRYDGLMESLGGAPTPAVGWAAGIERLAMLVGAPEEAKADAVVVVENDERLADAIALTGRLRAGGFSAELVANGSPRKRFDKAKKLPSHALVSFAVTEEGSPMRVMGDGGERHTAVESFIVAGR